jgi:hypothetical protein
MALRGSSTIYRRDLKCNLVCLLALEMRTIWHLQNPFQQHFAENSIDWRTF